LYCWEKYGCCLLESREWAVIWAGSSRRPPGTVAAELPRRASNIPEMEDWAELRGLERLRSPGETE
jgi:hypothetical protein